MNNLKIYLSIILIINFLTPILNNNKVNAKENNSILSSDYINTIPKENFYILGPGDKIKLEVTKLSTDINKIFTIDGEGIANLNRLNRVYIAGLTIEELTEILNKEYSKFVISPDVKLEIIEYRPIKIFVSGEVANTGLHVMPGGLKTNEYLKKYNEFSNTKTTIQSNFEDIGPLTVSNIFPTIVDLIRQSGGLTEQADLTNIEVTRLNSITNGGGKIKTKINLLESLQLKDSKQNLRLLDGDTVSIGRSEIKSLEQISNVFKSNLNPSQITIYVGGNVDTKGPLTISKQASMNEALNISGLKIFKGPITLIRSGQNGILEKRTIRYSKGAAKGTYKNPYLNEGDIFYVGKNKFSVASEIISEITAPVQGIVNVYGIYKIFSD